MRVHLIVFVGCLVLCPPTASQSRDEDNPARTLSLCDLVNNWKDHHEQRIRVRAIYRMGAEGSWLYDPMCRNGQGQTDVSFRQLGKRETKKLDRIISKDKLRRRAWVVFEGVFYGPEPWKNVDPRLPANIRERLEKAPTRYGHMGAFESMIEVTHIVEATEVPSDTP